LISSNASSEGEQAQQKQPPQLNDGNSFVLINARIFTVSGVIESAAVRVENGIITELGQKVAADPSLPVINIKGQTVTPGLIDAHTHTFFDSQLLDSLYTF